MIKKISNYEPPHAIVLHMAALNLVNGWYDNLSLFSILLNYGQKYYRYNAPRVLLQLIPICGASCNT